MVERICLAAEEPSAANQILLHHSGPILSDIKNLKQHYIQIHLCLFVWKILLMVSKNVNTA